MKSDPTKEYGFSFEELGEIFPTILELQNTQVQGLMTIPPLAENPGKNRKMYKKMHEFRDTLEKKYRMPLPYLSMGMSDDYEIAIEEGATIVRLGRILFEQLDKGNK